jgi:O-antigen ligase
VSSLPRGALLRPGGPSNSLRVASTPVDSAMNSPRWDDVRGTEVPLRPWRSSSRLVILLLLVTTMSWRPHSYYSGGMDTVVVAKALISLVALSLAWFARVQLTQGRPMGNRYVWMAIALLTVSTFGAWIAGDLLVAGVSTLRILVLVAVVVLLVKTFPPARLLRDLIVVMLAIALLAIVTGAGSYLGGGRLQGGVPPLHPNELAVMCGVPIVGLAYQMLQGRAQVRLTLLFLLLLASVWATGSRTSLLAVIVALIVLLVQARVLSPVVTVALAGCVPILVYLALGTDVVVNFFSRDAQNLATLNSRSIGWRAALDYPDSGWNQWFGSGLAVRLIPVEGQYWESQGLDGSWVSAFVHAGGIGVAILLAWVLSVIWRSFKAQREDRMLLQSLLALILLRSVMENGLFDATPTFIALLLLSLFVDRVTMGADTAARPEPLRSATSRSRRVERREGRGPGATDDHRAVWQESSKLAP